MDLYFLDAPFLLLLGVVVIGVVETEASTDVVLEEASTDVVLELVVIGVVETEASTDVVEVLLDIEHGTIIKRVESEEHGI